MERPVLRDAGRRGKILRLPKQDIRHAILLKLVASLSGLNAAYILVQRGHVLEQAAIERVVDDAQDDVVFLSLGVLKGETDLHRRYLDAFWAEEFGDVDDTLNSHQSRPMVPRDKIRAYIVNTAGVSDPSSATRAARVVAKTISGFVHLAAPHIMEIYRPDLGRFSVTGMLGTPRESDHRDDYWNYVYRVGLAFAIAAKAFGSEDHSQAVRFHLEEFQEATGRSF